MGSEGEDSCYEDEEEEVSYSQEDYPNEEEPFDNSYNDLRDLYNIHRSNESLYSMLGSNLPLVVGEGDGEGVSMLRCPICDEWHYIPEVSSHMMERHSGLYISMIVLMNPSINLHNVSDIIHSYYATRSTQRTIQNLMFQEGEEEPSYEELLDLCNHIGYHKPGIPNMDSVSSVLPPEERASLVKEDDTCRICLECLAGPQELRKIKRCNHVFCGDCIHTWFTENKTCPLCNLDVSAPTCSLEEVD